MHIHVHLHIYTYTYIYIYIHLQVVHGMHLNNVRYYYHYYYYIMYTHVHTYNYLQVVHGMHLSAVHQRIRGPEGTPVALDFMRSVLHDCASLCRVLALCTQVCACMTVHAFLNCTYGFVYTHVRPCICKHICMCLCVRVCYVHLWYF